jgi:solute carrier family 25 carnitine/acylcarnitine transporter 20/29
MLAGWTVSVFAAPVEHIKARLQVQYHNPTATPSRGSSKPRYSGPIDCARQIYNAHGIQGIYHGFCSTLFFRSFFFFWWSSYDVFSRKLREHTAWGPIAINFWAGGISAQVFWLTSYPSDVLKQKIMTDHLEPGKRKFSRWWDAAAAVYREQGMGGYWR